MILSQAYKQGLPAPLLCKKDLSGRQIARHSNGMGTFKIVYGKAKGFLKCFVSLEILFYLKGDDFRVGRNLAGNRFAGLSFIVEPQVPVIVNISIKTNMNDCRSR